MTHQSDAPQKPTPNSNWAINSVGGIIYGIRWGLAPMYIMLWVAIAAYTAQFGVDLFNFIFSFQNGFHFVKGHDATDLLLWVLGLIDMTMIANLVVMTTIGGYSTFVREFRIDDDTKPRWMNGLDSSSLKIKMGMSLVGVTGIHLLKTFMELEHTSWDTLMKEVVVHIVFMGTTLAFTLNAYLMKKMHAKDGH